MDLNKWYEEEMSDNEKYLNAATEMEEKHPEYAAILRDVAHEEKIHASHIKMIMDEME